MNQKKKNELGALPKDRGNLNKAGYTATPVACRWAGAVLEKGH